VRSSLDAALPEPGAAGAGWWQGEDASCILARVVARARAAAGLALAAALSSGIAAAARAQSAAFRVQVDEPATEATVQAPLVELRGQAGSSRARGHDLVIVLDLSESVLHDTGVDLDGDGPDGRTDPDFLRWLATQPDARPGALQTLRERRDFEDTVLAAELEAAEALVERLEPPRFRTGIVVFSDDARVVAPVGSSPARLREALAEVRRGFQRELRGTNFAAALETARSALVPDLADPPVGRELGIVFLSDGAPTLPVHGTRARDAAVEAAAVAGLAGIRLHAFALGPEGAQALDVLEEMAALTGGRVEQVERPAETAARLRRLDLAGVADVAIENETTGEPARAVRLFPDGSFDGFVELAPGPNRLRVEARSRGGERAAAQLRVVRRDGPATGDEAARLRALLDELRRRTAEMAAWARMEQRRREQVKVLELEPGPPPTPAPGEGG
jgi:hypothetical protein